MWYILENEQQSYDLSDRLIRAISNWQIVDGGDDVEDLLDQGADVNRLHGMLLPLHCACMVSDAEIVAVLLQRGAMVNAVDGYGRTALHYAAQNDNECMELLIENGAQLNITDGNGDTPLHWAAFKNRIQSIEILLTHGANINAFDFNHETPLSWAAKKSHFDAVEILLTYNAIPDSVDLNGFCPLVHASRMLATGAADEDEEGVVDLLLRAMGQFDLRDGDGQLPHQIGSDSKLQDTLLAFSTNPRSLKQLCRYSVRSLLGSAYLPNVIDKLLIPVWLQMYLQLHS